MTQTLVGRDRLDVLLLDAGGVLVDPDWEAIAGLFATHQIHVSALALAQAEPWVKRQLDTHETIASSTDESRYMSFFDLVLQRAGWSGRLSSDVLESLKAEHARRNLWRRVLPGIPAALARLRAAGLRLAVVSNANGTVRPLFQELALTSFFEVLLDSLVEGLEKPDPRIFLRALDRLGVSPDRALHVGDLYHIDVVGARSAGVAAALIDAGGYYNDADCPRFPSLPALVDALLG